MSSTAAPFGLRPVYHPSGTVRPKAAQIISGYANNIFQYSPVQFSAAGYMQLAAAGGRAVGCFMGVEYTPNDGRRRVANTWPAGQVATQTGPSGIVAYYTEDAVITYELQANAALAIAAMGQQYNWTVNDTTAGNTTTGLSNVALDVASAAANANVRVVGITPGPDNDWGDAFTIAQVQISQHQYVADIASV